MRRFFFTLPGLMLLFSTPARTGDGSVPLRLPWREAGLSERAAAAHLLDRLAYGARPGEVDRVVSMGLEAWVERQLAADLPEVALAADLARYDTLRMPARQIAETFPSPGRLLARARAAGVVSGERARPSAPSAGESAGVAAPASGMPAPDSAEREQRRKVLEWARAQGYRSQRELAAQLLGQRVFRAVEAENQLAERLTDFWFNHLTVSMSDNEARSWILAYERDAIRPHVFGSFRELLEASAKHPAMLVYLDNDRSVAAEGQPTTLGHELGGRFVAGRLGGDVAPRGGRGGGAFGGRGGPMGLRGGESRSGRVGFGAPPRAASRGQAADRPGRPRGLNENYARELLELHTLGVDGGYAQEDVVEVARALTGWSIVPLERGAGAEPRRFGSRTGRANGREAQGRGRFVVDGDFLFRADSHDAAAKRVLGHTLPAGRGIEDGEAVLDLVAFHPATARHLAAKLAVRFVADDPPASLVDRLAATFTASGGDLRATVRALVESPEFWSAAARRQKIKSPLEVVASALRASGARVEDPRGAIEWIARMGQPLYASPAPTGFGDRAEAWVASGSLLARMNFGLALAAGRVGGVRLDLASLAGGSAPTSADGALAALAPLFLPERDVAETIARLTPLLEDPDLPGKLAERAATDGEPGAASDGEVAALFGFASRPGRRSAGGEWLDAPSRSAPVVPPSIAASVAGLILGSPEFQRR